LNSPLGNFTQAVLEGRVRERPWDDFVSLFFNSENPGESLARVDAWAKSHGITWHSETRHAGRQDMVWIVFSRPHSPGDEG
jgi:hypothetical protein